MDKKILLGVVAGVVLVGAASFYGGTIYEKSAVASTRGQGRGSFTAGAGFAGGGRTASGGFTAGEIIGKDATSITIKMQNGSTKIVLISGSTQIMKSTVGTDADLGTGTNVMVVGTANSDGSVTAQSVQIRPAGFSATGSSTPRQ